MRTRCVGMNRNRPFHRFLSVDGEFLGFLGCCFDCVDGLIESCFFWFAGEIGSHLAI